MLELTINQYISEKSEEIQAFISNHKSVLLKSSPASGKTTFFAEMCINKKDSKTRGRIIFCSPFLIIQSQFKEKIESAGAKIDFELNGESKRKHLIDSDVIITSTYKSLYKIEKELTEDDLIIIDEAHSLLYYYTNNGRHEFADKVLNVLYKTKARKVLMTGTPASGITEVLELKELIVNKENVKATINVQLSNERRTNIINVFAENCIETYGKNSLNIIFIKDRRRCQLFKEIIEKNFDVNALVLTSTEKGSMEYIQLIKQSIIPDKYTFLICTNVISTGANILNDNVGKALMFDEYNPVEIKQFSKRFRKKLDIEIDLVNRKFKLEDSKVDFDEIIEERDFQREFFKNILRTIEADYYGNEGYFNFDNDFFNYIDKDGTPENLIDIILKRYLIQEAYFINEISKVYNDPNKLINALDKYNDILPLEINDYSEESSSENIGEAEIINNEKEFIKSTIDDFIINQIEYLKAIEKFLHRKNDYYEIKRFENYLHKGKINFKNKEVKPEITKKVSTQLFKSNILTPLIENEEFLKNRGKCLYFLKNNPKNKQNKTRYLIYFNDLLHHFFDIIDNENQQPKLSIKKNINRNILSDKDKISIRLINSAFNYLILNENIYYEDFESYIFKNINFLNINNDRTFPYNSLVIDYKKNENSKIDVNVIRGLMESIFLINPNRKRKHIRGKKVSYYTFRKKPKSITLSKENYPLGYKSLSNDIENIKKQLRILDWNLYNKEFDKITFFGDSKRILNTRELILFELVDENYYTLFEK